jgi:hypothetical protein
MEYVVMQLNLSGKKVKKGRDEEKRKIFAHGFSRMEERYIRCRDVSLTRLGFRGLNRRVAPGGTDMPLLRGLKMGRLWALGRKMGTVTRRSIGWLAARSAIPPFAKRQ